MKRHYNIILLLSFFIVINIQRSFTMNLDSMPSSIKEACDLVTINKDAAIKKFECLANSKDIREASHANLALIDLGQSSRLASLKKAVKKNDVIGHAQEHITLALHNAVQDSIDELDLSIKYLSQIIKEMQAVKKPSQLIKTYLAFSQNAFNVCFGFPYRELNEAEIKAVAQEILWQRIQDSQIKIDNEAILKQFIKNIENPRYYHAITLLARFHYQQMTQQSSFDKAKNYATLLCKAELPLSHLHLKTEGLFILGQLAKSKNNYEEAQTHLQQAAAMGMLIRNSATQDISLQAKIALADLEAKKNIAQAITMLKNISPLESSFGLSSFSILITKFLLADYLIIQDMTNVTEAQDLYEEIAAQSAAPGLAKYAQQRLSELATPELLAQFLRETLSSQSPPPKKAKRKKVKIQSDQPGKELEQQDSSSELPKPQLDIPFSSDTNAEMNTEAEEETVDFDMQTYQVAEQLLTAIKGNNLPRVRELLNQGADPLYVIGGKRIIDHALLCAENDKIMDLLAPERSTTIPSSGSFAPKYQVEWTKEANKEFDSLQDMEQRKIEEALQAAANKLNGHIKKLQGKQSYLYRIAVGDRLRIGFNYSADGKKIVVEAVGYHENFYE